MNIDTANRLAKLNAQQLKEVAEKNGYQDVVVVKIVSVDVRQHDVHYRVEFKDDGSFEDAEPMGSLYLSEQVVVCDKTGAVSYETKLDF